jgi:hypothetical protein
MAKEWSKMFNDPITLEPMKDPVVASDGHTYDYESLCEWMVKNPHRRSPITKEVLRPRVYSNLQMLEFLRLKPAKPTCRRIYSRIQCREMTVPLDGTLAHKPWIVRFLTQTGWRRKPMTLAIPVTSNEGKWEAVGPPIAYPFESALEEWIHDFGLDSLVTNPSCLSAARLSVEGVCRGNLEEICGSDLADKCRS